MAELDDYSEQLRWVPKMRPPSSFTPEDEMRFQAKIDAIVGLSSGHSIIKLSWCPREFIWQPYNVYFDQPKGYTLPLIVCGWDENRVPIAPPRWMLLQYDPPEHYANGWEKSRYAYYRNCQWDAKGPCPEVRYTEVFVHSYHDGECCTCRGLACYCAKQTCWGTYADPDEGMLNWVGWQWEVIKNDPDVNPYKDAREFESPMAQKNLADAVLDAEELEDEELRQRLKDNEAWALRGRTGALVNGFGNLKRTQSGLYVSDDI